MANLKSDNRETRVAAYGLIQKGEHILLCRISEHITKAAGMWTLPGGGLEFGEDPAEGMIREVREETGLHVRPASLVGVGSITGEGQGKTVHSLRLIYHAEVIGGELRNEVDGTTDLCAWHAKSEIEALDVVELVQEALDMAFSD